MRIEKNSLDIITLKKYLPKEKQYWHIEKMIEHIYATNILSPHKRILGETIVKKKTHIRRFTYKKLDRITTSTSKHKSILKSREDYKTLINYFSLSKFSRETKYFIFLPRKGYLCPKISSNLICL